MKTLEKKLYREKSIEELRKIIKESELELIKQNRPDIRGGQAFKTKGSPVFPYKKHKKIIAFCKMLIKQKNGENSKQRSQLGHNIT